MWILIVWADNWGGGIEVGGSYRMSLKATLLGWPDSSVGRAASFSAGDLAPHPRSKVQGS